VARVTPILAEAVPAMADMVSIVAEVMPMLEARVPWTLRRS
jgi:hypothetical protein